MMPGDMIPGDLVYVLHHSYSLWQGDGYGQSRLMRLLNFDEQAMVIQALPPTTIGGGRVLLLMSTGELGWVDVRALKCV